MRLTATLAGANEAPGPGDPKVTGTADVTLGTGTQVCYSFSVKGAEPIQKAVGVV